MGLVVSAFVLALSVGFAFGAQEPGNRQVGFAFWTPICFALALLSFWSVFRAAGRFTLRIVRGGAALAVRRSIFGIPLGTRELPLHGVVDVLVEERRASDFWTAKYQTEPFGRLLLRDHHGAIVPVTPRFYRGVTLHYQAAISLRRCLGLPPYPGSVEERIAHIPPVVTPVGTRLAFLFVGFSVGAIFGPLVSILFGVASGLVPRGAGDEGLSWLGFGAIVGAVAGGSIAVFASRAHQPR